MEYNIALAGIPLRLTLRQAVPDTLLAPYLSDAAALAAVSVSEKLIRSCRETQQEDDPDWTAEYNAAAVEISEALLPFGRCIFHGMAFLWRGKAWIFTAPSGTGKTTQYALWKLLYGDELSALNGDKPVLECRDDGTVWVHPSPWQGKENIGSMRSAPLGGIICLARGENRIERLDARQALAPVFSQIIVRREKAEVTDRALRITEHLLTSVPIWRLTNRGDRASARLTHDTLQSEAGGSE